MAQSSTRPNPSRSHRVSLRPDKRCGTPTRRALRSAECGAVVLEGGYSVRVRQLGTATGRALLCRLSMRSSDSSKREYPEISPDARQNNTIVVRTTLHGPHAYETEPNAIKASPTAYRYG